MNGRWLAAELCARDERPEATLHDRGDRHHAAACDNDDRAARRASAHLHQWARTLDRVEAGHAASSLERVTEQPAVRPEREERRVWLVRAEEAQLTLQRLLAELLEAACWDHEALALVLDQDHRLLGRPRLEERVAIDVPGDPNVRRAG